MLKSADLVELPYTPDLTQAGIRYACRSLAYTYDRMGGSAPDRMRRIVCGVAVELAFRRYLVRAGVSHDNLGTTPFTDPDRYDVSIYGRRIDLKSFQLFDRQEIRQLHRHPEELLDASALVPVDQIESEHFGEQDLYIFAFMTALLTRDHADLERAVAAGQPSFLIHALPPSWSRPRRWASLLPITLKSESGESIGLELGGQDAGRGFSQEQLTLPPKQRTRVEQDFYTLAYLHPDPMPSGRLGVHTPQHQTYIIHPQEWENIWIYGLKIYLAGYLPRGEFRRQAAFLPTGSRVWQYARTRTDNYSLSIANLRPLQDLIVQARKWENSR